MSMLAALALLAPAAMPPVPATLWTSGHGFPCYRQPVIVSAGGSRLLAFVEGRFSSPCAPAAPLGADTHHPSEVGGLNLRISEDGQNWGPSKIIYGNAVSLSCGARTCPRVELADTIISVLRRLKKGRIWTTSRWCGIQLRTRSTSS